MSVIKGKRSQNRLRVLDKAYELCKYTLSILRNEKVFPKSYRWLLCQKIADECVSAMACIKRANSVNVKDKHGYEYRRGQQIRAYAHLEALLELIDVAFNVLAIDARRVEFWTGLVVETETSLISWGKADKKRYESIEK